jgi:hypothetical protein
MGDVKVKHAKLSLKFIKHHTKETCLGGGVQMQLRR